MGLQHGAALGPSLPARRPRGAPLGAGTRRPVARLAEPAVLRQVLDTIGRRIDGQPAAGSVVSKRRRVLFNAVEYAVELGLLTANPLPGFKWKAPRVAMSVDKRSVVNPVQARTLLAAVRVTRRSGPRLVAFFGLMYFTALRPEEAANLRKHNLSLPDQSFCTSTLGEFGTGPDGRLFPGERLPSCPRGPT